MKEPIAVPMLPDAKPIITLITALPAKIMVAICSVGVLSDILVP